MSIKQRKEKGVLAVPVAPAAGSVASAMAKICAKHFVELKEEDAMAATAAAGSGWHCDGLHVGMTQ